MEIHFPSVLRVRVPLGLPDAVTLAARLRHTTPAEYARQALIHRIEADGVRLRDGKAAVIEQERE